MNLTKSEKHVLLHTTGLDRSKDAYRNHFVCGENHTDFKTLESLVGKSLMDKMRDNLDETNVTFVYRCTEKGIEAAKEIAPTDLIIISDGATSIREHFEDEDEETGVITMRIQHAAQRLWARVQKLENKNEAVAKELEEIKSLAKCWMIRAEDAEKELALVTRCKNCSNCERELDLDFSLICGLTGDVKQSEDYCSDGVQREVDEPEKVIEKESEETQK